MKTRRRRQSLVFPSVMLIVSFWATALVMAYLAQELLEILSLTYATIMSSVVVYLMFKARNEMVRVSGLNGGPPLATFEARMNKLQPQA